METISFPWKGHILPRRPTRGTSVHEMFDFCGSLGCIHLVVPPRQCSGAASYSQQPKPSSPPQGRAQLGQSTLERGEKEQEENLHPGQLSTLAWSSRR